jgi:carbon storage regulator CsrA
MLSLTRKVDEVVYLTIHPSTEIRTVTMKILRTTGDAVRLGFDADRSIDIHRDNIINNEPRTQHSNRRTTCPQN